MTISQRRIEQLLLAEQKLQALENAGVDNWDGYSFALEDFNKESDINELTNYFIVEIEEGVLVEFVEVDYPAGREAGHSVTLTEDGEAMIKKLLKKYVEDIKEVENR